jgi:hypothetical protein
LLLAHVRQGFERLDAGEIDAFELDHLIHHYKKSAAKLWSFCSDTGSRCEQAVGILESKRERDDEPDWWEVGAARRDRR